MPIKLDLRVTRDIILFHMKGVIMKKYSLGSILKKYRFKVSVTLTLVILELVASLLYPLFIGFAINDLLNKSSEGVVMLIALTIVSILIGALRRFIDSRVYGKIFEVIAQDLVKDEYEKNHSASKTSARISLLSELIEFFENTFPEIVGTLVGTIGTLVIIWTINRHIFFLCLLAIILIMLVYALTSKLNWNWNKLYNDEAEQLVTRLEVKNPSIMKQHFKSIIKLNIKLSDLEVVNFSLVTLIAMSIFIVSLLIITKEDTLLYGTVFSILMYVFEFVERVIVLPLYYQHLIRLQEISNRLSLDHSTKEP